MFRVDIYFEGEWQSGKSRHVITNWELLMPYTMLGVKSSALAIVMKLRVSLALPFYYTDLGLRRDGSYEGTRRSEK